MESMTLRALIEAYTTDQLSPYHKGRFVTRRYYQTLLRRIDKDHGSEPIKTITARKLLEWHHAWVGPDNKHPMAHALMGMMRTLAGFGGSMLESEECRVLKGHLSYLRFQMGKPRSSVLTTEQVIGIRKIAHEMGFHSVALAQAFQSACTFRQRDVLGEWVPASENVPAIIEHNGFKWLRGITWREIDAEMILRHVTSKRQKPVQIDLKLAPMVMDELRALPDFEDRFRTGGPIILDERYGLPFNANRFRRVWRRVADAAGVPKEVKNMDTRAGAITEALNLGAEKHSVMKTAAHSQQSTTERYARGDADEIAKVMQLRAKRHEELLRA